MQRAGADRAYPPHELAESKLLFTEHYKFVEWRHLATRVARETWNDDVFGRAAQLAYFWFFSLIPMLLIVTVILGYMAQGEEMRQTLLGYVRRTLPGPSFALVRDTLNEVSANAGAGKLWIGIVTTLWAASSGMSSVIDGLNRAYEVREARPWWRARTLAALLTIVIAVLIVIALSIFLYGGRLGTLLGSRLDFAGPAKAAWPILEWLLVVLFALIAFLLVYRFAPNLRDQKLWWILPGATAGVAMWVAVSLGLRLYLRYFRSYSTVYGALGAVLILLLWLYASSAALLIGGELNSEIENAAARRGAPDAKRPGERAPREAA
jgi:membrane protein